MRMPNMPATQESVIAAVNNLHRTAPVLADAPAGEPFRQQLTPETVIYLAPYDAKQLYMTQFSNVLRGDEGGVSVGHAEA